MMRPRKRVFGFALFAGLGEVSPGAPSHAESGGAYFVDLKASSPMAEYLTDASLASLASNSATASSVNMVSCWEWRVSMPVRYQNGWEVDVKVKVMRWEM
jgi:hypothetical protein